MRFPGDPDARNDPPRPLLEHFQALREALVFAAAAWAIAVVVAFVFSPQIRELLVAPAREYQGLIQGMDLVSGFSVAMSIAVWGGTALAFPFILYAILRFIFPALTLREKTVLLVSLSVGSALFLAGAVLAYAKTLPLVVTAFQSINAWVGLPVSIIRIEGYVGIVLKTIIAFGLVFQLPLVLFVLGAVGLVSSAQLRAKRRVAIVLAFVLAMFLTPPDPMSQIIMAVPLCLLYELSIWALWLKERGRRG